MMVNVMSKEGIIISVIGSTSLKGKVLLDELPASGIELKDIKLLDEENLVGTLLKYDGGAEIVTRTTSESLQGSDLIFLCGSVSHSSECLEIIGDSRVPVIDLSGCSASDEGTAMATADLPLGRQPGCKVALPDSLAVGLATILNACLGAGEIELASATCLVSVSDIGKKGSESLHSQLVELMNFGNVPLDILGRQLIFNIHPSFGEPGAQGRSTFEEKIESQVRHLLPQKDLPLVLSIARVPLFFGTAVSLFIKFKGALSESSLRDVLGSNAMIELSDADLEANEIPSPLDASDKRVYQVGRLMAMGGKPSAFLLWFGFDNILRGAVLEAIELAKEMLTATN